MYGRDAPGSRGRPAFFCSEGHLCGNRVYQALEADNPLSVLRLCGDIGPRTVLEAAYDGDQEHEGA